MHEQHKNNGKCNIFMNNCLLLQEKSLTYLLTYLFIYTVMLLYFHCISGAPELWMWGAIASSCWLIYLLTSYWHMHACKNTAREKNAVQTYRGGWLPWWSPVHLQCAWEWDHVNSASLLHCWSERSVFASYAWTPSQSPSPTIAMPSPAAVTQSNITAFRWQ